MRVGILQSNQTLKVTLVVSWNAVGPTAHVQPLPQTSLCLCMSMQCALMLTETASTPAWANAGALIHGAVNALPCAMTSTSCCSLGASGAVSAT